MGYDDSIFAFRPLDEWKIGPVICVPGKPTGENKEYSEANGRQGAVFGLCAL